MELLKDMVLCIGLLLLSVASYYVLIFIADYLAGL